MSVTEYIAMFAQYFVDFINMVKEFFANFGGTTEDDAADDE